jgi:hypothetical protein
MPDANEQPIDKHIDKQMSGPVLIEKQAQANVFMSSD